MRADRDLYYAQLYSLHPRTKKPWVFWETPLHPIEQISSPLCPPPCLPAYHDGDTRTMLDALAGLGRRVRDPFRRHDALHLAATASCQDRVRGHPTAFICRRKERPVYFGSAVY